MPNPSNSDLVGEALRRIEEADISPDDVFDFADAVSKLAQQLEQAEQREKRYRESLERIAAESECSITNPAASKHNAPCAYHTARAALTTPDSATEQEEG